MDSTPGTRTAAAATAIRSAASAFLRSLAEHQLPHATAQFDVPDRFEWTYVPGVRPGIGLYDLSTAQRELAMKLLDTGLSATAAATARDIMALERILLELERSSGVAGWERRDPQFYWVRVMGDPDGDGPWAWSVGGHHLSVHLTIVGDKVAGTPQFFGANPARVPRGPAEGLRTLPATEDLGRALLLSLSPEQQQIAIVAAVAPNDLATRADPVADPKLVPCGISARDLDQAQTGRFTALIGHYFQRAAPDLAAAAWSDLTAGDLGAASFAWAGPLEPGAGHYYAVRHPQFLLEYDNVQNDANHIHSVWRDLRLDWGHDLLAAHRAAQH